VVVTWFGESQSVSLVRTQPCCVYLVIKIQNEIILEVIHPHCAPDSSSTPAAHNKIIDAQTNTNKQNK
jgi:hypothetical protein